MRYISDLHIHSKYSRATSKELVPEKIDKWCRIKGIDLVATGDFTHPSWYKELTDKLAPCEQEPGFYYLKSVKDRKVKFVCGTELSCIYTQGGKVRRIHLCVFVPSLEVVKKINLTLEGRGVNLKSDGRPIMGLSAKELTKIILDINENCLVIPSHAWTPWFSVFGSKSGFDSIEECFGEMSKYIYAIETGLSSDPAMNWRLSTLDNIVLISNSDAHSPANLGREANVFEATNLDYHELTRIIKEKDKEKFKYTIEFFPEEGKYHFDGHRVCKISFSPKETKKHKGICPECGKALTVGVMNRVDELADREEEDAPKNKIPYKSLVPLAEIIGEALDCGVKTKTVAQEYINLIKQGGSEFEILLDLSFEKLSKISRPEIAEGVKRVREGKIIVEPGYDGEYGKVQIFSEAERNKTKQSSLF